ncbi:uroporphyrinogen-III synthase [Cyanobacterium aponinum UTEX 3222]|uniref:uroporphyrinogen-III synthase n=1 Tax=Cyanobacterium aponinum TaxID=379064 RepID=UPI002B4C0740|nr:uroporphyrinogen-III synthase [Cyanobacterium aponinum]WRL39155.1 uroporphyrinogen-III synthase [Cyanobacterium aponinum UTEX 3221]WRL40537.1 uroporphyrinogen-III synthase [Cyanobacterium aponinum UTEX 3222]
MSNYRESYPLAGKTILITRAYQSGNSFRQMLEAKGATVLEMPALEIKPPSSWQPLDKAINHIADFHWLILTSANGVEYFLERLHHLGKDINYLKNLKIAVVGKKTAHFLEKYNISPDFIPPDFIADSLVTHFPESIEGKKILFPRVETGGREILVQELTQQGGEVVEIPAYQSTCPDTIDNTVWDALVKEVISIITFASSKTVRNFHYLVTQALQTTPQLTLSSLLTEVAIASIGPQTSMTCQELLGKVDIEAQEYTLEGLVDSLVKKQYTS